MAGFPLRCFQRLSVPYIATRLCHWRDNRITRGTSNQVLSYYGQLHSSILRPRQIGTKLSHDVLNPARVPLKSANSRTLGTCSSPRMRWADIEVPNRAADVNSQARSACYPQSTFYPISDGPPIQDHRITNACFRTCSTCPSRSQAPLCVYALFARLPTALRGPLRASATF